MQLFRSRGRATFVVIAMLCTACSSTGGHSASLPSTSTSTPYASTPTNSITPTNVSTPTPPSVLADPGTYGPQELRYAYQVDSLLQQGITGKNQRVVVTVSYGNPHLQDEFNAYTTFYHLPPLTLDIVAPLGPTPPASGDPFDKKEHTGWAIETAIDVEMIHAMAPDAQITVLTSPVDTTEGSGGLPQFRQLIQFAMSHYPGAISSNSWAFSEASLQDAAGQAEIQQWGPLLQQATLEKGMTFFFASGDLGATDYTDKYYTSLSPTATTEFPADEPWVTGVGGTSLTFKSGQPIETAWTNTGRGASGGGMSQFFDEPSFQQLLATTSQTQLATKRGVPDVAAIGDPNTGVKVYANGQWLTQLGGTSIGTPIWAGILALANQKAGRPLGYINPLLYAIGTSNRASDDFRDITIGNNSMHLKGVNIQGYSASSGWDPITGFGSPIVSQLIPDLISQANH